MVKVDDQIVVIIPAFGYDFYFVAQKSGTFQESKQLKYIALCRIKNKVGARFVGFCVTLHWRGSVCVSRGCAVTFTQLDSEISAYVLSLVCLAYLYTF